MEPAWHKRLRAQEERRNATHTHYLCRDAGESLEDARERFRRMVELGRADENDDYIIFRSGDRDVAP